MHIEAVCYVKELQALDSNILLVTLLNAYRGFCILLVTLLNAYRDFCILLVTLLNAYRGCLLHERTAVT